MSVTVIDQQILPEPTCEVRERDHSREDARNGEREGEGGGGGGGWGEGMERKREAGAGDRERASERARAREREGARENHGDSLHDMPRGANAAVSKAGHVKLLGESSHLVDRYSLEGEGVRGGG